MTQASYLQAGSAFDGMSYSEMSGMPYTQEATMVKLGLLPESFRAEIAGDQEAYVGAVWDACPKYRFIKKPKLEMAREQASLVREIIEDTEGIENAQSPNQTYTSRRSGE